MRRSERGFGNRLRAAVVASTILSLGLIAHRTVLPSIAVVTDSSDLYETSSIPEDPGKRRYNPKGKHQSPTLPGQSSECMLTTSGPVMDGYDIVEYFNLKPGANGRKGSEEFESTFGGYTFRFANNKNMKAFGIEPTSYLPQFGGFDTYGIVEDSWYTVDTLGPEANPNVWKMISGKLYFFMYDRTLEKFEKGNITAKIIEGNKRWSAFFNDTEEGLNTGCYWFNKTNDKLIHMPHKKSCTADDGC